MEVKAYLQLIHTGSLDAPVSSSEKLPGVDDEKRESVLHHLPLGLILALPAVPQLLYLFGDGSLQEHVALEQSRVETPQLISAVQLGGRRRDGHQAAVGRRNIRSKRFSLSLQEEKRRENQKRGRG